MIGRPDSLLGDSSGALKRIAAYHPGLAQHLGATLRTGTFCTYSPDPRVPATWEG